MTALARFVDRRRRLVLAATVVFVVFAGAFGGPVAGLLDSDDDFEDPQQESVLAREAIEDATGRSATPDLVAIVRLGAPAGSPQADAKERRVRAALDDPEVAGVTGNYASGDRPESMYVAATFRAGVDREETAARLQSRLEDEPGVIVGGGIVAFEQVGAQVEEDLARAEMLAFPILFLLSLFVFRSVVAALLPLAVGATTIVTSFVGLRLINEVEPMSVFAINLITGLGLGLAIDYSLFMVSRFREELANGGDRSVALRTTMRTAGRTVLFSAVTVAAALAALIVFPLRFLFSMGYGGALVALTAAVVSLTVLPALLVVLGPRVNALSLKRWQVALHRDATQERAGPWYRFSQAVMRRPGPIAAATAALLIVIGLPFLRIEFTGVDASVLPKERSARVVEDVLRTEFRDQATSPIYIAVRAPANEGGTVNGYARALEDLPGDFEVQEPVQADGLWRIDVVADAPALAESSKQLVRDIRARDAPFPIQVGGATAMQLDQQSALTDSLPLAIALLAGTTLVILFVMTGSVVLPVKALVMNLLALSAAFGLLVLIFQDGRFESLLAYESQGAALDSTQPVLLFAVAFGLSTDYGVFLLTRIKEARDGGAPDREAVALGLQRTGRIVTYAALLFTIAIGAFATSEVIFIKQVGVGTALAVLIDAFLIRTLLVPSLMVLLGRWNWWAPRPLARLHARLGLREEAA
jgi:uncharacterized membrane protein YdfJ with MMPL/SSD domain